MMADDFTEAREAGVAAAQAFVDAFNALDHEALADSLNYPHVRLALGRFTEVPSREAFVERSRQGEPHLKAEGWDHTTIGSMDVVHAGEDKVHLAFVMERRNADGEIYKAFDTLWIATCQEGRWGIQFRSSYLR